VIIKEVKEVLPKQLILPLKIIHLMEKNLENSIKVEIIEKKKISLKKKISKIKSHQIF
jgi:hypothetical protein